MPRPLPPLPPGFDPAIEFPISTKWVFFNHAGVAPISRTTRDVIEKYARQVMEDAYLTGGWYKHAEVIRRACARLINADPEEIAFIKNTSEGLAFVANGLDWKAGDEILSTAVEYPANIYPWMDVAQRFGAKFIMVPERRDDGLARIEVDDLISAVTPRTRMIAISHVEFASGFRNDLATIGAFCAARGILLTVDAIQSCAVVPVDVKAMHIDFLSADGHKWMLGPEGCGFFFCARKHLTHLRPEIGWMNVVNATDYGNYDFTLRWDAKRFECGSYAFPGILAFGAALQQLLDIGLDLVGARILALTDLLCEALEKKGYHVVSSRRPGEDSGIVSFILPGREKEHPKIVAELEKQRIIIVEREGRLRATPHFYQSPQHMDTLVAALPSAGA